MILPPASMLAMVDTDYAVGPMDGAWVSAVALTPDGDTVTNPATAVVEITVTGTSAKIKLSDGAFIAPKGATITASKKENMIGLGRKQTEVCLFPAPATIRWF